MSTWRSSWYTARASRLPAAAVQRAHQQHGKALPLGEALHERLQLGDGLAAAAELEQRLGALLHSGQPKARQPRNVGIGIDLDGVELGEDIAAPQRKRGVEQIQGPPMSGRGRMPAGLHDKTRELRGIELAVGHCERVPRCAVKQPFPVL